MFYKLKLCAGCCNARKLEGDAEAEDKNICRFGIDLDKIKDILW